jgi:hypothetical protein
MVNLAEANLAEVTLVEATQSKANWRTPIPRARLAKKINKTTYL